MSKVLFQEKKIARILVQKLTLLQSNARKINSTKNCKKRNSAPTKEVSINSRLTAKPLTDHLTMSQNTTLSARGGLQQSRMERPHVTMESGKLRRLTMILRNVQILQTF